MTLKILVLALLALPVSVEDRPMTPAKQAELEQIAAAVYKYSDGDLNVMSLTLALGHLESAYSSRIGRSECKPLECDPVRRRGKTVEHRARGFFQLHRNGMSQADWDALKGPGSIDAQAKEAVRRVKSAFATCRGEFDVVQAAIAQYSGAGCKGFARVPKGRERVLAYVKIRSRVP